MVYEYELVFERLILYIQVLNLVIDTAKFLFITISHKVRNKESTGHTNLQHNESAENRTEESIV